MKKGIREYKQYINAHRGKILLILLILLICILSFMILDEKYQWTGQAIKDTDLKQPIEEVASENSGYQDVKVTSTS